jgi:6-pyruvoyltetrahydropterin/6-carboxytetrahydropterin synthase
MKSLSVSISRKGKQSLPASSIFVEDDSLHFEYGHCLPKSKSCSVLHGHSSRLSAEIFGEVGDDGMILDFGLVKEGIKQVLAKFDHKFIICRKYAVVNGNRCHIAFTGPNGRIELDIPLKQTVLLEAEATSENIASEVAREILDIMPEQVKAVKAFFFEGANKGASLFRMRDD